MHLTDPESAVASLTRPSELPVSGFGERLRPVFCQENHVLYPHPTYSFEQEARLDSDDFPG
jgi:hypothetical protein